MHFHSIGILIDLVSEIWCILLIKSAHAKVHSICQFILPGALERYALDKHSRSNQNKITCKVDTTDVQTSLRHIATLIYPRHVHLTPHRLWQLQNMYQKNYHFCAKQQPQCNKNTSRTKRGCCACSPEVLRHHQLSGCRPEKLHKRRAASCDGRFYFSTSSSICFIELI